MKRLLLAATACFALAAPAHADDLPSYDVMAYCQTQPAWPSLHDCVTVEYAHREFASKTWQQSSPAVRTECSANAFGSYATLNMCLDSHTPGG
jgi:hypothetical protein